MRNRNNLYPYDLIGKRIATARKAAGMSQEDLAKILGLGRTSITNMESGCQPISIEHLLSLGRGLAIDPTEIIRDIPAKPA